MPKMEVVSHVYDEAAGVDKYVFNPGNMEALIKIVDNGESPKCFLACRPWPFNKMS